MRKVSKIILKNFKFFFGEKEININRKNLLLYGENGSGKSSIYWAFYTFFQSVFKDDDQIKKYFNASNDQNLVNRFAGDADECVIAIEFADEHKSTLTKQISLNTINTKTDSSIREITQCSDLINYRLLARLYDFSNREEINLFPLFEKEILMFINFKKEFEPNNSSAFDWWEYIKPGMQPRSRMHDPEYSVFQNLVHEFNHELETYLNNIIEASNDYLQEKFNEKLKLELNYIPASYDDFEEDSTTRRNHITIHPKILLNIEYLHDNLKGDSCKINRPQSFLNEARLTTIALSIRFAILKEKYLANTLKLLVLDDLLISLDMSNRDFVLNLILNEFKEYQIIILTHDRMFYELAKHKIKKQSKEDWVNIEMYNTVINDIPQPFITESKTYLEKAKKFFELKEYEVAGNFLRKEAESFCKDFLPRRKHMTSDFTYHTLDGLINQCILYAKENELDITYFEELDSFKKFILNPTSHDSYDVQKFNNEILKCIHTLEELRLIKMEPILQKGDSVEFELHTEDPITSYKFDIVLQEELRLIKQPTKVSILARCMINYNIFKDGVKTLPNTQHSIDSLKIFYDKNYKKSDKSKNVDFWEVLTTRNGNKLKDLRSF